MNVASSIRPGKKGWGWEMTLVSMGKELLLGSYKAE